MDERNEQIKRAVVEATELIQSGATAGHEIMQVFATSVAQRVPDVRIEELHSMVIAMLGEIQRNYERANKIREYSMKFADPNRPNETVREMVERRWPIQRRWPEDCAARTRGRPHGPDPKKRPVAKMLSMLKIFETDATSPDQPAQ